MDNNSTPSLPDLVLPSGDDPPTSRANTPQPTWLPKWLVLPVPDEENRAPPAEKVYDDAPRFPPRLRPQTFLMDKVS